MKTKLVKERFEAPVFRALPRCVAVLPLVIACASFASRTLADDNVTQVAAWKINRDPFSNNASSAITGYAEGGHAVVTIGCKYDGTPTYKRRSRPRLKLKPLSLSSNPTK
jgi:hypothetical protein